MRVIVGILLSIVIVGCGESASEKREREAAEHSAAYQKAEEEKAAKLKAEEDDRLRKEAEAKEEARLRWERTIQSLPSQVQRLEERENIAKKSDLTLSKSIGNWYKLKEEYEQARDLVEELKKIRYASSGEVDNYYDLLARSERVKRSAAIRFAKHSFHEPVFPETYNQIGLLTELINDHHMSTTEVGTSLPDIRRVQIRYVKDRLAHVLPDYRSGNKNRGESGCPSSEINQLLRDFGINPDEVGITPAEARKIFDNPDDCPWR